MLCNLMLYGYQIIKLIISAVSAVKITIIKYVLNTINNFKIHNIEVWPLVILEFLALFNTVSKFKVAKQFCSSEMHLCQNLRYELEINSIV